MRGGDQSERPASTAEQRRRVEEEHRAIVDVQTKRRMQEESLRADSRQACCS